MIDEREGSAGFLPQQKKGEEKRRGRLTPQGDDGYKASKWPIQPDKERREKGKLLVELATEDRARVVGQKVRK